MQSGQSQCQAIKPNRMQCSNEAFVTVGGTAYCRLDFNLMVGQLRDEAALKELKSKSIVINPEQQKDMDVITNVKFEQ